MMTVESDNVDFGNMVLSCVFCKAQRPLKSMIPFARARFRRRRWITALCDGDAQMESHLREALKNGSTKFLCDWHFADICFSINTFGEWKLKKDALPNPHLRENERTSMRIYMINHLDSTIQRNDELRRRRVNFLMLRKHAQEKERVDRENSRSVLDKMRRTFPRLVSDATADHFVYEHDQMTSDYSQGNGRRLNAVDMCNVDYLEIDPEMPLLYPDHADGPSEIYQREPTTSQDAIESGYFDGLLEGNVEYSDESDIEMEIIQKMQRTVDVIVSEVRQCEYCHVVIPLERSKSDYRMRTWPYDDVKHEKYLSIMGFPKEFDEEMRRLWVKRRIEPLDVAPGSIYKYPTLNICQQHLDMAGVPEQIDSWLSKYCVLCDEELGDENLLLPFPLDRSSRLAWAKTLFSGKPLNNLLQKQQRWNICQYERIPRGPQGVVKCPLCDTWNVVSETTQIRTPNGAAERNFLVEFLISGDKATLRKGVEKLSPEASTICKAHMEKDPFEQIAERKLVASVMVQCVACSAHDLAQNMTPFPT
ncbi:hypothetical protein COOONC_02236 [Cooperia oncophora]